MDITRIRKAEHQLLDKMLHSEQAELLALYGRRRVGKTFIIRDHFESIKNILFFDITGSKNTPMREQIANFTNRLGEVFYGGAQLVKEKNWNETFRIFIPIPLNKQIDISPLS